MVLQRRPGRRRVVASQSQHHIIAITVYYLALFFFCLVLPKDGDAFLLSPVQVQQNLPASSAGPTKNRNHNNDGINTSFLVVSQGTRNTAFTPTSYRRLLRDPLFSTSSSSLSSYKNDHNKNHHAAAMHSYYLATTVPGLAGTLQTELIQLGGRRVETSGDSAVTFAVPDVTTIYTILLWSRTAHKIMELLIDNSDSAFSGGGATTTTTNGGRRPPSRRRLMKTRDDVYKFVRNNIPVRDLLWDDGNGDDTGRGQGRWRTLSVSTTLNNPRFIPTDINHSHFTALNVKNALVDAARDEPVDIIVVGGRTATTTTTGSRPDVDLDDPDVPLVVVLRGIPSEDRRGSDGAEIAIYRTLHTGSLHRRGYRSGSAVHKAGLKESLAAGLLLLAGWPTMTDNNDDDGKSHHYHLIDPMAGSGTFLIEAAMMSADYAPGLMRIRCEMPGAKIPPIVRWRQLGDDRQDERLWPTLLLDATARAKRGLARLLNSSGSDNVVFAGNDVHRGSVQLAEDAIRRAGFSNVIQMSGVDCQDWKGPVSSPHRNNDDAAGRCLVVCNPPWGVRLTEDMEESWDALRVFLRDVCPARYGSTTAWLLSGNAYVTRRLKLRRSQSIPLQTGEQQLRWLEYNIAGSGGGARSSSAGTSQSNRISSSSSTESVREESGRWFRPML